VISLAVFDVGHEIPMLCKRDKAFCFVLQNVVYPSSAHGMLDEAESRRILNRWLNDSMWCYTP